MSALADLMNRQRAAFLQGAPDYARRMQALAALRDAVHAREAELLRAISEDFGGRAHEETLLLELFPLYDQIRHARRHLKAWMRRRRVRASWFLMPSRAYYQYQPLGVVGVIGAWNYPVLLTLGPIVDALAAGNHVLLKPSEVTPRASAVIAAIIAASFPEDYVACVTGGVEVASEFSALPFDHLLFTGSTRVGRMVMAAAAANLTPVTLELGGKSPAILHESYSLPRAVERVMTAKLYNAGQTCVAPDYVLLPEGREAAFEEEARRVAAALYPRLADNADYSRIVSTQHYDRLSALVEDAAAKGARVVPLNSAGAQGVRESRAFPPTLVFGAGPDTVLMQEEIFGPILPGRVLSHAGRSGSLCERAPTAACALLFRRQCKPRRPGAGGNPVRRRHGERLHLPPGAAQPAVRRRGAERHGPLITASTASRLSPRSAPSWCSGGSELDGPVASALPGQAMDDKSHAAAGARAVGGGVRVLPLARGNPI